MSTRVIVITSDPEWVEYEWLVEVDTDDVDEALDLAREFQGAVLSVEQTGESEDIENMDREVENVYLAGEDD